MAGFRDDFFRTYARVGHLAVVQASLKNIRLQSASRHSKQPPTADAETHAINSIASCARNTWASDLFRSQTITHATSKTFPHRSRLNLKRYLGLAKYRCRGDRCGHQGIRTRHPYLADWPRALVPRDSVPRPKLPSAPAPPSKAPQQHPPGAHRAGALARACFARSQPSSA